MNIAIVTGGVSGERDVSINSAKNVQAFLEIENSSVFVFPEERTHFEARKSDFSLVIPIIHGLGGEDGELQEYLDGLNIDYLFSNPATHKLALDKRQTKQTAQALGINAPNEISILNPYFPVFAKPNFGGSSISSKLCKNKFELDQLLKDNSRIDFLLEKPIQGREFTVGVIDYAEQTIALPVIEIISENGFFDYKSKYDSENLAREICPALINQTLEENLKNSALAIHTKINAKQISRSDFIVTDDGQIFFLEINTIPGLTNTSLIPKMLLATDIDIRDLFLSWCKNFVHK